MNRRIDFPSLDLIEKARSNPFSALSLWENNFQPYAMNKAILEDFQKTDPQDAVAEAREKFCINISNIKDPRALVNYTKKLIWSTYINIHKRDNKEINREINIEDCESNFENNVKTPLDILEEKETQECREMGAYRVQNDTFFHTNRFRKLLSLLHRIPQKLTGSQVINAISQSS
ncbi:hypothetical protein ACFL1R_11385 [Candidatus Latescibacterota bacterium]